MIEQHSQPPTSVDRTRAVVRRFLLVLAGVFLTVLAFSAVTLLVLSSGKIEKNIVLIPPILDGKINSFVFASLSMDGRGNASLKLVPIATELKLTPLTQVLETDQQTARLQRAQVSVQVGVLVDEVWSVTQLPTELTKQTLLHSWQEQRSTRFDRDWWQTNWLLSNQDVEVKNDQSLADLAKISEVARITPAARRCSVAIVNTTQSPGLASAISDYLEKIGLVVIRVTDNKANSDRSHLVIAEESKEVCQEAVAVLDYISPEPLELVINQEAATTYRAALVFLVGQNMIQVQEPAR